MCNSRSVLSPLYFWENIWWNTSKVDCTEWSLCVDYIVICMYLHNLSEWKKFTWNLAGNFWWVLSFGQHVIIWYFKLCKSVQRKEVTSKPELYLLALFLGQVPKPIKSLIGLYGSSPPKHFPSVINDDVLYKPGFHNWSFLCNLSIFFLSFLKAFLCIGQVSDTSTWLKGNKWMRLFVPV